MSQGRVQIFQRWFYVNYSLKKAEILGDGVLLRGTNTFSIYSCGNI